MWKKVRRPQEEKSRYIKRLKKCWIYKENQDMKKLVSTDFSAENWLILGKKWSMMIATADKYGCRTLPMRNWHCYSTQTRNYNHTSSSDITYEELTPVPAFAGLTSAGRMHYVGHYLWGIDTTTANFINNVFAMSDITYEELTPSSFSPFYHLFYFKSDITYEELTP